MVDQMTFQAPMTPPRQKKRAPTTAPCIHEERRRRLSERRASGKSRVRLCKLKPINLFGTELGVDSDSFLILREENILRPHAFLKTRSFSRGRTRSFCTSMAMVEDVSAAWLEDVVSESNAVTPSGGGEFEASSNTKSVSVSASGVRNKRRRSSAYSFTPNMDTIDRSAGLLEITPQRSQTLIHKFQKRSQKSRLQDILFDVGDAAAAHIS